MFSIAQLGKLLIRRYHNEGSNILRFVRIKIYGAILYSPTKIDQTYDADSEHTKRWCCRAIEIRDLVYQF